MNAYTRKLAELFGVDSEEALKAGILSGDFSVSAKTSVELVAFNGGLSQQNYELLLTAINQLENTEALIASIHERTR